MIFEKLESINTLPQGGYEIIDNVYCFYKIYDIKKPIIITFPPAPEKNEKILTPNEVNINTPPWGYNFLTRFDVNIISFSHLVENHYFNSKAFCDFIYKLSPYLSPFPSRLGYSFSKGGFAIGTYAEVLGLDHALLVHPVSTKNLKKVPWDKRTSSQLAQKYNWEGTHSDINLGNCKGYILLDPTVKIDVNHADRFIGFKKINIFALSHCTGIRFLAKHSNLLKDILPAFIQTGKLDFKKLRKNTRLLRYQGRYYDTMLKHVKKETARNKIKRAQDKYKKLTLGLTAKEIDTLKDAAITLENINFDLAKSLIEIAYKKRPNGHFIKQKYNEYNNNEK